MKKTGRGDQSWECQRPLYELCMNGDIQRYAVFDKLGRLLLVGGEA